MKDPTKNVKNCPIATAMKYIGRKWTFNILRDLYIGKKRFTDFIDNNQGLSTKMLSHRLVELEKDDIIEKVITNKTPLRIEYALTDKGRDMNRVLYEIIMFSFKHYPKEVFCDSSKADINELSATVKKMFNIHNQ